MDDEDSILPADYEYLEQDISNQIELAYQNFSQEKSGYNHEENDIPALFEELPDSVILKIFGNLTHPELCHVALVCKHWLWIVYDSELWKYVDLSKFSNITEQDFLHLIHARLSPLLKTLDLSNCKVTPVILHELTDNCPQLNTLVLQNSLFSVENENAENSVQDIILPDHLVRLDIRRFKGGGQFVHTVLQGQDLSKLECFGFGRATFCPIFKDFSAIFKRMHLLRILECVDCDFVTDDEVSLIAKELKFLESLDIKKCKNVRGSSLKILIENATCLRSLNISSTNIENEFFANILWDKCELEELDLSFCDQLNSETLVTTITHIKRLTHLAVNKVGKGRAVMNNVFKNAFDMGNWRSMSILDIAFSNKVTSDVFLYLTSSLERVLFRTCYRLTYKVIATNISTLTNLKALECGSLFAADQNDSSCWIELIENLGKYCKGLQSLVLVKCSEIPFSKISTYKVIIVKFLRNCKFLKIVNILYSEQAIVNLFETCVKENGRNIEVTSCITAATIPPLYHSLDTEINRQKFSRFFGN